MMMIMSMMMMMMITITIHIISIIITAARPRRHDTHKGRAVFAADDLR